jgi:co-chaperonin GroES (HSP10)
MKPTKNNVLVSRVTPVLETQSGIILRESLDPDRALIEAVGPDVTEVSVGEEAMVDWNRSTDVGDGKYIISIDNIVMVIEK